MRYSGRMGGDVCGYRVNAPAAPLNRSPSLSPTGTSDMPIRDGPARLAKGQSSDGRNGRGT
jgi:hypothetical protein